MTLRLLDVARMATTDPPPVPWLVEPLLIRSHVTMLAGREGTGKSLLALALAAAGGNGRAVGGMEAVGPLRTLYVDAENGDGEVHRRIRALGAVPQGLAYATAEAHDLRSQGKELQRLVVDQRPDVVVLDSLRSLSPSLDENDSAAAEIAIAPLKLMARNAECAVLILHHAGKGDGGRGYRGSTGLGAAVEAGFTLSRDPSDPDKRTRRQLSCWKMRPAAEPEPLWISLDASDGRLTIGQAEPYLPAEGAPTNTAADELAQRIGAMVTQHGEMSRAAIGDACGRGPRDGTVGRALAIARNNGLIEKSKHGSYCAPNRQRGEVAGDTGEVASQPDRLRDAGWMDTLAGRP